MEKFISNTKNPYEKLINNEKETIVKGQFISKSKAGTIQIIRNNTANITGRKITFKHV